MCVCNLFDVCVSVHFRFVTLSLIPFVLYAGWFTVLNQLSLIIKFFHFSHQHVPGFRDIHSVMVLNRMSLTSCPHIMN